MLSDIKIIQFPSKSFKKLIALMSDHLNQILNETHIILFYIGISTYLRINCAIFLRILECQCLCLCMNLHLHLYLHYKMYRYIRFKTNEMNFNY